jgi:UDP-2,4-diacetamido-2,4,6-trideoxy-beta-L-altropyranose hydrolase
MPAAPSPGRVAFRADASHAIGFGHVARLFAIVEELEAAGGQPCLFLGGDAPAVGAWARDRGREVDVRAWTAEDVLAARPDAVVVDGPALADALVPRLAGAGIRSVMIDDVGSPLAADVVVNHNFRAAGVPYPNAARALLGRRYLMLRQDIRRLGRDACRAAPAGRLRLVVTFGGSDPTNATARAVRLVPTARPCELVVVAGPGYRHDAALAAAMRAAEAAGHTTDLRRAPDDPGALFASADAALCSAGGTLGELAFLGCAALAFATVRDQLATARAQAEAGVIAGGGAWDDLTDAAIAGELAAFLGDDAARAQIRAAALATADGDGPRRIVDEALR